MQGINTDSEIFESFTNELGNSLGVAANETLFGDIRPQRSDPCSFIKLALGCDMPAQNLFN